MAKVAIKTKKANGELEQVYVTTKSNFVESDSSVSTYESDIRSNTHQTQITSGTISGVIGSISKGIVNNVVKIGTITIPGQENPERWIETASGSGIWVATLKNSEITGIISNFSKIDIQLSPTAFKTLLEAKCSSIQVSNENKTIKLHVVGNKPSLVIQNPIQGVQINITEVT